jgi:hypothetical protein
VDQDACVTWEDFPLDLRLGWFELYDGDGRWLGMLTSVRAALEWVERRPPGTYYRLVHRDPPEITGRWLAAPQEGGRHKIWPVNRFHRMTPMEGPS